MKFLILKVMTASFGELFFRFQATLLRVNATFYIMYVILL